MCWCLEREVAGLWLFDSALLFQKRMSQPESIRWNFVFELLHQDFLFERNGEIGQETSKALEWGRQYGVPCLRRRIRREKAELKKIETEIAY